MKSDVLENYIAFNDFCMRTTVLLVTTIYNNYCNSHDILSEIFSI